MKYVIGFPYYIDSNPCLPGQVIVDLFVFNVKVTGEKLSGVNLTPRFCCLDNFDQNNRFCHFLSTKFFLQKAHRNDCLGHRNNFVVL